MYQCSCLREAKGFVRPGPAKLVSSAKKSVDHLRGELDTMQGKRNDAVSCVKPSPWFTLHDGEMAITSFDDSIAWAISPIESSKKQERYGQRLFARSFLDKTACDNMWDAKGA